MTLYTFRALSRSSRVLVLKRGDYGRDEVNPHKSDNRHKTVLPTIPFSIDLGYSAIRQRALKKEGELALAAKMCRVGGRESSFVRKHTLPCVPDVSSVCYASPHEPTGDGTQAPYSRGSPLQNLLYATSRLPLGPQAGGYFNLCFLAHPTP